MVSLRVVCVLPLLCVSSCALVNVQSPRERIIQSIRVTDEKSRNAEVYEGDDPLLLRAASHPTSRKGEVKRYFKVRPWSLPYCRDDDRPSLSLSEKPAWPKRRHAPALRELLSDEDPEVRGVAVEALATLHIPEDIPRIAALMDDEAESGASIMGDLVTFNRHLVPREYFADDDSLWDFERRWAPRTVSDYSKKAIHLMTGEVLDSEDFDSWWEKNSEAETSLWFWKERMRRAFSVATEGKRVVPRVKRARKKIGRELAKQSAEVEAKARLLSRNTHSDLFGMGIGDSMMGPYTSRRLSSDRLMELLEERNLWSDVDWRVWTGAYDSLVRVLMGQADVYFERKDVAQLRRIWERKRPEAYNPDDYFCIGISRLLEPAIESNIDDLNTRDGILRYGLSGIERVAHRGKIVRELVHVGLPLNEDYLVEYFFNNALRFQGIGPDVRTSVMMELRALPRTEVKRELLERLLEDQRFTAIWRDEPALGTQDRKETILTINAFAQRELIEPEIDHEPLSSSRWAQTTARDMQYIIKEALRMKNEGELK